MSNQTANNSLSSIKHNQVPEGLENKSNMQQNLPVRIVTAGSVDDGKSTLIGRLLYDCQAVLSDQLLNISQAKHARVVADDAAIDLALLTDGLIAEREQGITIDVAYRYFSTPRRKFILIDAPGHEQYTRNLVTGASQANVAIVLVDATRIDFQQSQLQLLTQTRRHAILLEKLGITNIVFAVNKMDLLDYSQSLFIRLEQALLQFANEIGLVNTQVIPLAALLGDNVVRLSENMPWYQGSTLLQYLENLAIDTQLNSYAARYPVQLIIRQDGAAANDFRGLMGRLETGVLKTGDEIQILPSGAKTSIKAIYCALSQAAVTSIEAGAVATIEISDDLDITRGDMIVAAKEKKPILGKRLLADLCWLDQNPLVNESKYLFRINTHSVAAKVANVVGVLDVHSLDHQENKSTLVMNDIGQVEIILQHESVLEPFAECHSTGAFILIDPMTHHTVAAGMVRQLH